MEDVIIEVVATAILLLYPMWRIFGRAGLNPALSLVVLIPFLLGFFLCGLILAASQWKLNLGIEDEQ